MKNIKNKEYKLINLTLIAIYCFVFIKSIIDGRFIESIGRENVFSTRNLIEVVILLLVFIGLLSLIAFTFQKLQLLRPYIIFAIISIALMMLLSFSSNGSIGSISFPWYSFIEIVMGFIIIILFPVILIISLLMKRCLKKFTNKN